MPQGSEQNLPLEFGVAPQVQALLGRIERHFQGHSPSSALQSQSAPGGGSKQDRIGDDEALVVGIFGAWGAGKTHWLRYLEQHFQSELRDALKRDEPPSELIVPVFFNAWRYEKEQHLIVPLLKTARR